jgi:hypothetical protein
MQPMLSRCTLKVLLILPVLGFPPPPKSLGFAGAPPGAVNPASIRVVSPSQWNSAGAPPGAVNPAPTHSIKLLLDTPPCASDTYHIYY